MNEHGMPDCEAVVERVYDYLDGELDPGWSERIRDHLERCGHCYPYFRFERAFLDHVRRQGLGPVDTARLETRIRAALFEQEATE